MKSSLVFSKYSLPVLFFLASCQQPVAENRLEQMAKGCCECTAQLLQLNQQAAQAPVGADFKALEAEYKRTKECLATMTAHFGKLKPDELTQLEKLLQAQCPALAAQHELLRELLGE